VNELLSVGSILLVALLAGHAARWIRIPEVTGYILAGVAVGPAGLHWLSSDNLAAIEILGEVTLGLILFSIGSAFDLRRLRERGPALLALSAVEALLASTCVGAATYLLTGSWPVALLLGAIAAETAAASTLMVLRECHAEGDFSDTLLGVVAVNNVVCLVAFSIVSAGLDLGSSLTPEAALSSLYRAGHALVWQVAGSLALGFLVGLLLARWAAHVDEEGELMMLLAGAILLCVGASHALEVSPLVASLGVGAAVANLSARPHGLFAALSRADPPLYAIFFVIAGADLDLGLVWTLGPLGAAYVVTRALGKFSGAFLGARLLGFSPAVQRNLGTALLSQAGLAIGLVIVIERQHPEYAALIAAVVLGAVVVFELIGPIGARWAVLRAAASSRAAAS